MYITQITIAILIAFLSLIAWNRVRNQLGKDHSRNTVTEAPGSPRRSLIRGWKLSLAKAGPGVVINEEKPPLSKRSLEAHPETELYELKTYKQLYYKLHNLEQNPEILPQCRELLVSLLSSTIGEARRDADSTILSLRTYSRNGLDNFLKAKDKACTDCWEQYLARREAGGPREIFKDQVEARWWLKQAAPVKYVDGAWLGHINKITTPFKYRNITKNAWQVMSEELGDGDLAKNHVFVYQQLMDDIGAGLPAADSKDFISPRHKMDQTRCWKAAIAQLLISLFPHDFLPESLGFNMAYESLPLHLLKTVKELREVQLNPYYFELHISIDNADSGHAAMALAAVADYIDLVEQDEGTRAARIAWKRVQAGYILAEGLPTTPESPSLKLEPESRFPRTTTEAKLLEILAAKTFVAHKIHCNSRLKIGRRSLVNWLEPRSFANKQWQKEFLTDLEDCKPWVVKGDSGKSRLMKELSWEGKMFGSFTQTEVELLKTWIDELRPSVQVPNPDLRTYYSFTEQSPRTPTAGALGNLDILVDYPVLSGPRALTVALDQGNLDIMSHLRCPTDKRRLRNLLPIWFTSRTLLEALPCVPVRVTDLFGSAVVRVLRAQIGFDVEGQGVAGMDEVHRTGDSRSFGVVELGLEMCRRADICIPARLKDIVRLGDPESVAFSRWMISLSMQWLAQRDVLVGMSWAFMELHEAIARLAPTQALLDRASARALADIAKRERAALLICKVEIENSQQRKAEFERGLTTARRAIGTALV